MDDVGHLRKRDGAWRWNLFEDTADAERWVETFTLASWFEYLRQRRRGTEARAEHGRQCAGTDPPLLSAAMDQRFDPHPLAHPQGPDGLGAMDLVRAAGDEVGPLRQRQAAKTLHRIAQHQRASVVSERGNLGQGI